MIVDILITLFLVFILLGFLQAFDIYKNYKEDAKVFPPKPAKTIHQIILPIENSSSIEEMEMFFRSIHTMRTIDPQTQLTFEIHSDGGIVKFYVISNTDIYTLIRSSLEARFPGVNFIEVEDPFTGFDQNWTKNPEKYQSFNSLDFKFKLGNIDGVSVPSDLMPSLSWKSIQNGSNPPTNDPMNMIISSMQEMKTGEYAVLQIILRSIFIDSKKYKKGFEDVRKQLMTNATTDGGNALTEEEKTILNEIQRKMNSVQFGTKIRLGYFSTEKNSISKIPWYFLGKSFLAQFGTPFQVVGPTTPYSFQGLKNMVVTHYLNYFEPKKTSLEALESPYTKVTEVDREGQFIDIQGLENIESYYRKKQQYVALIDRQFKYGAPVDNFDVESLSCIFHFPTTHEKTNVASKLQNLANETVTQNPGSWSTPPANLPF
jgi:hypothetical protein